MARAIDIPVQFPSFDMRGGPAWRNGGDGRQRFQFNESVITITLTGTPKIKILCVCIIYSALHKQYSIPPVCKPAARVRETNLERRIELRIQEHIITSPAHIWTQHLRVRPQSQGAIGQHTCILTDLRQYRSATCLQLCDRPESASDRPVSLIGQVMRNHHLWDVTRKANVHGLLQPRLRFCLLCDRQSIFKRHDIHMRIIWQIGTSRFLWRVPQTMSPIKMEHTTAGKIDHGLRQFCKY